MTLTADHLREVLAYEPDTGEFRWNKRMANRAAGSVAGTNSGPYTRINIDGASYYAHRLAFLHMTGEFPKFDVDHRDLNKKNNAWGNLRPATRLQNAANVGLSPANTSGVKGVSFHIRRKKWMVNICYQGKKRYLGSFETKEDATEFRQLAADMIHAEFVRHG